MEALFPVRMRWKALGIIIAVAFAGGCIAGMDPGQDPAETTPASSEEESREEIVEAFVFQEQIEQPQLGGDRLDADWPAELGEGLTELTLELSWGQETNSLGVEVETPEGVHQVGPPQDPMATSIQGEVPNPTPGPFTFHLTSSEGAVLMDEARLEVEATFLVPLDGEARIETDATTRGPVNVEETGEGYRAWVTYEGQAPASDSMEVSVDTVNGEVHHAGASEDAEGLVTAWARGDTPEQAKQRLEDIDVDLLVQEDRIEATASAPDWEDRGAGVDTGVPASTTIQGTFSTTNGGILFDQARVNDASASTTNGPVEGTITGQGSLGFDTTNGAIDVAFTPTASSSLDAHTTNGGVELSLNEDEDTGYRIDASTTNGAISENMDEASLSGSDEQATLETNGYDSRSVQVTGTAGTTNGNVHFASR